MTVIDKKSDYTKNEKIIIEHLNKLDKQLEQKKLISFWTFPDTEGFKKIGNTSKSDIKKMIKKDLNCC